MQLWIGLGYKNVLMQVHAKSVPHKINLLTWEIKGLKEKDSVAEWKKKKVQASPLAETRERVDFFTVALMQIWPLGIRSGSTAPYSDDAVRGTGEGNWV